MNAKPQPRYGWPGRLADAAEFMIPVTKQFIDLWQGQWLGPVYFKLDPVAGTNLVNMTVQDT